jgi:hypothetical protein
MHRHKNKKGCLFRKSEHAPFTSNMTISLLQLSHEIKPLEDKLLKSTSHKTIVIRFQNSSLILLIGHQEKFSCRISKFFWEKDIWMMY